MEPRKEANVISLIAGAVSLIMGTAAGISLHSLISRLNGWQALGYVLVGGIFISLAVVILTRILSFFYDD